MYSSPEQVLGEPLTPASDIFQAGLTLYFAATGRSAFTGKTIEEIERSLVGATPSFSGLMPGQGSLLSAMLVKNPAKRPDVRQCQEIIKEELRKFFDA